jgi:hypothetical protein
VRLDAYEGFDDDVVDLSEDFVVVYALACEVLFEAVERPLRTIGVITLALLIPGSLFLQTIVRQVYKFLFKVRFRRVILLGGEAHQSVVVHIYTQWIETCDTYIHSQIVLETVYQVRVDDVFRYDAVALFADCCVFVDYADAASAGRRRGLLDPSSLRVLFAIGVEASVVFREDVRNRANVVLLPMYSLHP